MPNQTRRDWLRLVGGAGIVGIAGCGSSSSGGGEPSEPSVGTGATELTYGFEAPSLDDWAVENESWGRLETYAWSGQASAGIETATGASLLARASPEALDGGAEIESLTYYWRETSDSFGGGIAVENADGNIELFTGTDNPQWFVVNGSTQADLNGLYEGDGYDRWIRVDLSFDWDSETVAVTFTDTTSSTSRTETYELAAGENVETISIRGFKRFDFEVNPFEVQSCYMYWDGLQVTI